MGDSMGAGLRRSNAQQAKLEQGEFLLNEFERLFDTHAELAEINQRFGNDQKLRILCYQISEYPTLIETFITFANKSQSFLERSLFCSWFSFLIADQLKLSVITTKELFVAGLSQDLSENFGSNGYSEASVGFLDVVPRLSDQIKIIASEHLECFDGTGGPVGKTESQLSRASQVLIVSNEIADLLQQNKRSTDKVLSFSKTLPVLRLNASVYFKDVYRVAAKIIIGLPCHRVSNNRLNVSSILDTQNSLSLRWPHVVKVAAELSTIQHMPAAISLKAIARRAWMMVTTAGVLSDDLSQWLSQLDDNEMTQESIQEVVELEILLEDFELMLTHFHQLFEKLLQNERLEISPLKRSKLSDLCDALNGVEETFDLEEFTILNMCN